MLGVGTCTKLILLEFCSTPCTTPPQPSPYKGEGVSPYSSPFTLGVAALKALGGLEGGSARYN
jgi:hypothetical protein